MPAPSPQAWRRRVAETFQTVTTAEPCARMRDLPWQVYTAALDMGIKADTASCTVAYGALDLVSQVPTSRERAQIAINVLRQLGFLRLVHQGRGSNVPSVYELTMPLKSHLQARLPEVWAYLATKGIKPDARRRDTATPTRSRKAAPVENLMLDLEPKDRRDGPSKDRHDGPTSRNEDRHDGPSSYKEPQYWENQGIDGVPEVTTDAVHIDRALITELRTAVRELQAQKRAAAHGPPGQRGRHRRPVAPETRGGPDP